MTWHCSQHDDDKALMQVRICTFPLWKMLARHLTALSCHCAPDTLSQQPCIPRNAPLNLLILTPITPINHKIQKTRGHPINPRPYKIKGAWLEATPTLPLRQMYARHLVDPAKEDTPLYLELAPLCTTFLTHMPASPGLAGID